jgi:putative thioredoxin
MAHAFAAEGDHEAALRCLLAIVREDRSFREDGARVAMLRLFQEVGDRDPLTRKYRRKLEMTLF